MAERKKFTDIEGKNVSTSDGNIIGTVKELLIDTEWAVTDIQVKVEKSAAKLMGLKTPLLGSLLILVETSRVKAVTDQVLLDVPASEFKQYVESRKA